MGIIEDVRRAHRSTTAGLRPTHRSKTLSPTLSTLVTPRFLNDGLHRKNIKVANPKIGPYIGAEGALRKLSEVVQLRRIYKQTNKNFPLVWVL